MNELMNTSLITVLGEQLELANEKIERLQKAVDLAVDAFNEICAGVPSDIWVFDEATKATNKIKQLTQGE